MDWELDAIAKEVYQILHRFHCRSPKFNMDSDLSNVEFFLLIGISSLLDEQTGEYTFMKQDGIKSDSSAGEAETEETGITIGEINKIMQTSTSAVSKKVTILEKKGLVKRTTSKTDRRNVYITLTDKGKELCREEKQKKHSYLQEVIRRMGKEDMEAMLKLANRAFDILDEIEKEEQ